jgi:hypothetical protein
MFVNEDDLRVREVPGTFFHGISWDREKLASNFDGIMTSFDMSLKIFDAS